MSFQVRRPGWPVIALTTAVAVFVFGFSVSTQGPVGITQVNGYDAIEGEILLKYRDDRASAHAAIELAADAESVEVLDSRGVRKLRSRGLRTEELLALLASHPDVEYAEPNYVARVVATPNDTYFNGLWGLFNTGLNFNGGGGIPGSDIDAPAAWDITTGSRANVVAIFDTGVDYTHLDLAANMWSAPAAFQVTVAGVTITCQAGTHGFNAILRSCDPMDDAVHGTHVAGTIGASGNNGRGVVGVNWTTSMMAIKFLGANGLGAVSDAVLGLEFVTQAKAAFASTRGANVRVLSNSWEGGASQSLLNAINAANGNDMLFVAAAGNTGTNNDVAPHYPSSYPTPNMVAVASSTTTDSRSSFSNYGASSVHLAAPGSVIMSTAPRNSYNTLSGTSMATPHVSGAAMLALSMCQVTTAELKALLLGSVDQAPAFSGITTTGGRLNVASMVQNCPYPKVTSLTVTPSTAAPRLIGTTINWTAIATGGQGPLEYRWLLYDGTAWTIARGWSSSNMFTWTPVQANDAYRVLAQVRSAWNTGAYDLATERAFAIKPPLSGVAIAPSVASPQRSGTMVTWTATPAGGEPPHQYQWVVWDGTAWTLARGWSTDNTFVWAPSANGDYRVAAQVRSAGSSGAAEFTDSEPFAIAPWVSSATLTPDVAAPRGSGTTVTWTAAAAGGVAPYEYRFYFQNGGAWVLGQSWNTSNTFAWTPSVADLNSRVMVQVRSAGNTGAYEFAVTTPFAIRNFASVTLSTSRSSPQLPNVTAVWIASASGGQGLHSYQFLVYDGVAWAVARPWSTTTSWSWTPTAANPNYKVAVQVRSSWNTGAPEDTEVQSFPVMPQVTSVSLTPDLASPRLLGTTVTFAAAASGGTGQYLYQWSVRDGLGSTTIVRSWSTDNVYVWTPTVSYLTSDYLVRVEARGAWSTGVVESVRNLSYRIRPAVSAATVTPNLASPQPSGATIQWTASASGGQAPYRYQWLVWNGAWTIVKPWSNGNTFDWTPTVANAGYKVAVGVRGNEQIADAEYVAIETFEIQ